MLQKIKNPAAYRQDRVGLALAVFVYRARKLSVQIGAWS
jgi:hypothetical protein